MNGILIVDKPAGWTSHDVVAKLRGALKEKRIGHGGTLDPMATGVLPVFIGRATRAAEFCENAQKEYIAGLRLGVITDTQDITGNVTASVEAAVPESELSAVITRFIGVQKQIPPMYSAIKIEGKKLYELARRGIDVPRPAREIVVYSIELLEGTVNDFLLNIVCSKGTYIRTLCHDIGAVLGCGGTMSSLRRTKSGPYTVSEAYTISSILESVSSLNIENLILPVDTMFAKFPSCILSEADAFKCKNGASCRMNNIAGGEYRFYDPDGGFLMFGKVENGEVRTIKSFFSRKEESQQ